MLLETHPNWVLRADCVPFSCPPYGLAFPSCRLSVPVLSQMREVLHASF